MLKKPVNFKITTFLQHILAAFIAFSLVFVFAGTSIIITGAKGDYSYTLYESDRNRTYEDSYLFNNILGNNLSDVIRLIAIRSQLETSGEYDSEKKIDVTAYVNKGTTLPGDYITAAYTVSDLLKWAQSGFVYETRNFTEDESAAFLSSTTTYTHLKNNLMSGGMNSYLSSSLADNSVEFTVSGNSVKGSGSHNILSSRYQTVDGKNIEDLVSSWEEYSLLCSNVEEAARNLLSNFEEYGNLLSYYGYQNSNLRYYVTRTINGSTSVFTNVTELSGETTGIDIKNVFENYGRYIYYCPYELNYETNTLIKENVVRSLLKTYSYAYPDQIKVYVAVDTNGYPCIDDFTQGKASFTKYMPYRTQILILCFVAAFIYILLFIITLKSPVAISGRTLNTEIVGIKNLLIMALPVALFIAVAFFTDTSYLKIVRLENFPFYAAIGACVFNMGFLGLVYGIAGKIKEKALWKDSLFRKLILGARNLILTTTDNGNVIIRTWIPYVSFIVLNLCLFKIGLAGIVIAAFMDILVGIYLYRQNLDRDKIIKVIDKIKNGDVKSKVDIGSLHSDNIALADAVNSIGEGIEKAVDTSMKDEKLKADLITNVSHDIKTPLTSIINYVDLIKREDIGNERVIEYVKILDQKSQKLKKLTEDLVEASKISSGNISIELSKIDFVELVNQTIGEFFEKFEASGLTPIFKAEEKNISIVADARHLWRVLENLFGNACKYALSGTRVYLEMYVDENEEGVKKAFFSIKNISAKELNVSAEELTKKFIRGDESRTTEGSGLGLSIAKNLTLAQGGTFDIRLDGDLFKVIIAFDVAE
ncbi:MAG: HAMP domain-containing histidine kinase [Butyrivibrio sp.]|uniref:sensor histidine kinase n=1 Tax=Butyrivibrio sp. TaxID=28121 RepID=UPI001B215AF1|nr:HAMP domain-containing sensor histidine kinase [Butyrivibrio sp.]MBO6239935.1 HAMP domain-containing histidine kinase [Butyrivibrio sp.]